MKNEDEDFSLVSHYNRMYRKAYEEILLKKEEVDPLLRPENLKQDTRSGVSLIIRVSAATIPSIVTLFEELQGVEPNQYYYPLEDLHITVLSIISGFVGFDLSSLHLSSYTEIIQSCLIALPPIVLRFSGLTMSSSCLMIQGFIENEEDGLNVLRSRLRSAFKTSGLQQTCDFRYLLRTAHVTILRLRYPMEKHQEYLSIIEKYRNVDFGRLIVSDLEFVENDWYMRSDKVKILQRFTL
jgi:2'-5' RNA ligase